MPESSEIPEGMPPHIPLSTELEVGDVAVLNSGTYLLMTYIGVDEDCCENGVFVFEKEGDLESWVLPLTCVIKYPITG